MTIRKCVDCGADVTGHNKNTPRCRSCGARHAYVRRYGKPPDKFIGECAVCGLEFSDYASNRKTSKSGYHFCSHECRAAWTGIVLSAKAGRGITKKTKKERDALYYRENADKVRKNNKERYHANRDKILAGRREKTRALKQEIIDAYGGKCECCGEETFEFLTIDHIKDDGAEHRRRIGGKGEKLYKEIKKEGFPQDGRYRLLCFNCNISRGFYGYCPHNPEDKSTVSHVPFNPGRKRTVAEKEAEYLT